MLSNVGTVFAAASIQKVIQTKAAGAALKCESQRNYCHSHCKSQTGSFQKGHCNTAPLFGCFTILPRLLSAQTYYREARERLSRFVPCHRRDCLGLSPVTPGGTICSAHLWKEVRGLSSDHSVRQTQPGWFCNTTAYLLQAPVACAACNATRAGDTGEALGAGSRCAALRCAGGSLPGDRALRHRQPQSTACPQPISSSHLPPLCLCWSSCRGTKGIPAVALCLSRRDVSDGHFAVLCLQAICPTGQESGKQEHKPKNNVVTYLIWKKTNLIQCTGKTRLIAIAASQVSHVFACVFEATKLAGLLLGINISLNAWLDRNAVGICYFCSTKTSLGALSSFKGKA